MLTISCRLTDTEPLHCCNKHAAFFPDLRLLLGCENTDDTIRQIVEYISTKLHGVNSSEDRALQRKVGPKFHKEIKALQISPSDASIRNALGTDEGVWQAVAGERANATHIVTVLPALLLGLPVLAGSDCKDFTEGRVTWSIQWC